MSVLEDLLKANQEFCEHPPVDYTQEYVKTRNLPRRQIAIVT